MTDSRDNVINEKFGNGSRFWFKRTGDRKQSKFIRSRKKNMLTFFGRSKMKERRMGPPSGIAKE